MLQPNNYLSKSALEGFTDEHLEDYTLYLEQQLANLQLYYSQVRREWDRRYPHE